MKTLGLQLCWRLNYHNMRFLPVSFSLECLHCMSNFSRSYQSLNISSGDRFYIMSSHQEIFIIFFYNARNGIIVSRFEPCNFHPTSCEYLSQHLSWYGWSIIITQEFEKLGIKFITISFLVSRSLWFVSTDNVSIMLMGELSVVYGGPALLRLFDFRNGFDNLILTWRIRLISDRVSAAGA